MLLYLFWPVLAALIPGGLIATGKTTFASIFIVALLALATYQDMTNALVVNRGSAILVTSSEIGVGVLLGWAIIRRLNQAQS